MRHTELLQQAEYHKEMAKHHQTVVDHHLKQASRYMKRAKALREEKVRNTSQIETKKILEKLTKT